MQTISGRFNGKTIELLDDAPVEGEAYVLITFLEGSMELAAARQQRRSVSVAMFSLDRYRQPLAQTMAKPSPTIDRQRPFSVGEVMTRKVISVASSTNVMDAMHLMHQQGITSVMVEPSDGGEWGIMTMRDVLKRIVTANRAPEEVLVGEIASRPLIAVSVDTSLRDCSQLMIDKNIRRAAVEEEGRPVGIISDTDIFQVVEERGWGPPPPVEDDHL
jgi:signal-transduction protein with cAMP-binding, CBS, and nucleotidyltransferase domain